MMESTFSELSASFISGALPIFYKQVIPDGDSKHSFECGNVFIEPALSFGRLWYGEPAAWLNAIIEALLKVCFVASYRYAERTARKT